MNTVLEKGWELSELVAYVRFLMNLNENEWKQHLDDLEMTHEPVHVFIMYHVFQVISEPEPNQWIALWDFAFPELDGEKLLLKLTLVFGKSKMSREQLEDSF